MDKIKTQNTVKDIKVLDKTADVTYRAKNAYVRTKEQAEQTQQTGNGNYVEYAGDKVKEGAQTAVQKAARIAQSRGKMPIQKLSERRKANRDSSHAGTSD